LKNAIQVLQKHQGAAMLQLDAPVVSALHSVIRDAVDTYEMLMAGQPQTKGTTALIQTSQGQLLKELGSPQESLPVEFARRILERSAKQGSSNGFLQQPAGAGESRASASTGIFGILETMAEQFEKMLSTAQKDELKAKEDYEALSAAKEESITVGKEKLDAMQAEDAGNAKALSDAKEDLELTRKTRTADVKFLRNLRVTCQNLDKEWELRSKTRSEEILAVSEALAIITEDDNREMLNKAQGFFQISASTEEGNGFGQALLDFITELSSKDTVPQATATLDLGMAIPQSEKSWRNSFTRGHLYSALSQQMTSCSTPMACMHQLEMAVPMGSLSRSGDQSGQRLTMPCCW